MNMRYLKRSVLSLLCLGGLVGLSGCQDDEKLEQIGIEQYVPEGSKDVAGGALVHIVDENDMANFALPLSVLREVEIEAANSDYLDFACEQQDGKWYLVPKQVKALDKPFEVIPVKVTPREYPDESRTLLVVLRQGTTETKASDPITSVYSEVIGKGTRCYGTLGNTLGSVLLYEQISKLGEEYLTANTTQKQFSMLELSGDSYEKMMESWSFNVGASFKKTHAPASVRDGALIPVWESKKQRTHIWSGTFDLGVSGSISSSEAYEYYLNLYRVKMSEVKLNMSVFEQEKADSALLMLLSPSFVNALNVENIDPTAFYDNWGTDIITQGSFGGYNIYIYGRKENVYEQSVGFDAQGSLKRSSPTTTGSTWRDIYTNANSDYAEGHFDVAYQDENYEKASKAVSLQFSTGGDLAINDPQKWLDGFNSQGTDSNWALIGYNVSSDEKTDSICDLYPIELIAYDMAYIYDVLIPEKTEADKEALLRLINNYNALVEAKDAYLDSKQVLPKPKSRLVLADILVKSEANGHKKGTPVPFVAQDPNDQDNYLTYYPMMANPNAPCDKGYAFESSQNDYVVGVDNDDKYWYYAMASEDDCRGIVDAVFCQSGTVEEFNGGKYYVARGVHADHELSGAMDNNYLYVKYYDEAVDLDPGKKVTAIGFANRDNDNKIIASTGGSELRLNATQTEEIRFNEFWNQKNWNWYNGQERIGKGWCYLEGGLVTYNQFFVVYTTQNLPIERFNENTVWQPKRWGDKN